jgi:hypothetical protein
LNGPSSAIAFGNGAAVSLHGRRRQEFDVYDFRIENGQRKRVPINDRSAEARAFVPVGGGTVLVYAFGYVAYHSTEPKLIAGDFHFAKPLHPSAAERMTRR